MSLPPTVTPLTYLLIPVLKRVDVDATESGTLYTMVSTDVTPNAVVDLDANPHAAELVKRCHEFFDEIQDL